MKKILFILPLLLVFLQLKYNTDGPNTWSQTLINPGVVWSIAINPATPQTQYAGVNGAGVWKTTNDGLNWAQSNTGLTNTGVQCVSLCASSPNVVYVGTTNTGTSPGVYKSTDAGGNWTNVSTGITDPLCIQALTVDPTNSNTAYVGLFDGTTNSTVGIFKTTNGGTSWSPAGTGLGTIKNILTIAINPSNPNVLYAGTSFDPGTSTGPSQIYKSVNGATSWTNTSSGLPTATTEINPIRIISISTADTGVVFAGLFMNTTSGGAFFSSNGGALWTQRNTGLPVAVGMLIRGAIIRPGSINEAYVGLDGSTPKGVYRTTDQGLTWTDFSGGVLSNAFIIRGLNFRTSPDSTLFASGANTTTPGQGVYVYTFVPVGIIGNSNNIPKDFALHQNYPNPFNPSTIISFDIPREAFVTVKVYDISGKEVTTIVNESKRAGSYNITFNASSLSSGIYFYKITAGDFISTKKMALVK
jgi:hypothetical protein